MRDIRSAKNDLILITALDRLARNVRHLLKVVETMKESGVALIALRSFFQKAAKAPPGYATRFRDFDLVSWAQYS